MNRKHREEIQEVLKTIFDPEIGINIYDLGIIYGVDYKENKNAYILMTFTSFACPFADILLQEIRDKVESIPWVKNLDIEITFDPPWSMEMMTDEGKLESGLI